MDGEKSPRWGNFSQAYDSLSKSSWKDMPLFEPVERKIATFFRLTPALRRIVVFAVFCLLSIIFFLYQGAPFHNTPTFVTSEAVASPECAKIPSARLKELQKSNTLSAVLFSGGEVIDRALHTGESICVVVAVPQVPADEYYDVPIPDKGPDNIHLLMNSTSVILTFPPLLPIPNQRGLTELFYDGTILYYAEKDMLDTGKFDIQIEQEWSNWHWARQYKRYADAWGPMDPGIFWFPTGIEWPYDNITHQFMYEMMNITQTNHPVESTNIMPNPLTVEGRTRDLNMRNPCTDVVTAAKGRWYKDDDFPGLRSHLVDEWGYSWEGDDCKTDFYTERDMMDCLENSNVHVYGDSNLRRISKTILSGGRWCTNVTGRCQNEDSEEWRVLKLVANETNDGQLDEKIQRLSHHWSFTREVPWHFDYGHNASLHFMFLRSIVEFPEDWDYDFFGEPNVNATNRNYKKLMDIVHPPKNMTEGKPNVILISINAWSAAFDPLFEELEERIPWFRDTILNAFPDPNIRIIVRLSNGLCCRENYGHLQTRYTGTRIQHVDDIIRKGFGFPKDGVISTIDPRIVAIDPINMAGRPGVVKEFGEVFNVHPRVSHVKVETQMILNAMCEREPMSGKARLRGRRTKAVEGAII